MMTTVLERLHTTKCSGFLGSRRMLLTVMSVPADVPRGLKVLVHSVVFMFHTWYQITHAWSAHTSLWRSRERLAEPVLLPWLSRLTKRWWCGDRLGWRSPRSQRTSDRGTPSEFYPTSTRGFCLRKESKTCQKEKKKRVTSSWFYELNTITRIFHPCIWSIRGHLMVWSKEVLRSWLLSLQKLTHVTPLLCARSNLRRHWPLWIFHTWTQSRVSGNDTSFTTEAFNSKRLAAVSLHIIPLSDV